KHRFAAVKAGIARSGDRAPLAVLPVDEEDVVELVDRFETENERRITVLLEYDRGKERRLEAVSAAVTHDAPKSAGRGPARRRLGVVRETIQVMLDGGRRRQPGDEAPLRGAEGAVKSQV